MLLCTTEVDQKIRGQFKLQNTNENDYSALKSRLKQKTEIMKILSINEAMLKTSNTPYLLRILKKRLMMTREMKLEYYTSLTQTKSTQQMTWQFCTVLMIRIY